MTHVSPREVIADAISGRAETDSIHLRQADAVLTALADAGFALTVRNRIAGGEGPGWPDAVARA